MQGLHKGVFSAMFVAWSITSLAGSEISRDPREYEHTPPRTVVIAERSHQSISVYDRLGRLSPSVEVHAPGASFIKLHFSQFRLPDGVSVEISNPDRSETWRYSATQRDDYTFNAGLGDDGENSFSAMSITGDALNLRLLGDLSAMDPSRHAILVDSILEGLPLGQSRSEAGKFSGEEVADTNSVCGDRELYDAVCWASSNSWEYERSDAVAKLINSRGEVCTAWRVGPDNMMFTAEHCLSNQSELDGAELWFNYESKSCGGSKTTNAVKVSGGNLIAVNGALDYALFSVSNFSEISHFPSFGLDVGSPALGEPIFIPQHGLGDPRQIALESDMNDSGECEVDSLDEDGYALGSDIGYYCDTTTSSSGSPVVSNISGRVVALHHLGGCMNSGVKISLIWDQVSGAFDNKVPGGSAGGDGGGGGGDENQSPSAAYSYDCNGFSCTFDGSDSSDPDGSVAEYSWSFGDGSTASGENSSHEFAEQGQYAVTLTVNDNDGASANTTKTVDVTIPNEEPTAKFSTACVGTQCDFDGNSSSDPDGEVVYWSWNFGDGAYGYGPSASHSYDSEGSYTITLTVEDDLGATDDKIRIINLTLPNDKPIADFSYSCSDLACTFNANSSSDPDGEITAWEWNFGDGSSASGSQVSHEYAQNGSYTVVVSVTDNDGATSSQDQAVAVSSTAVNKDPIANFNFDCTELDCSFNADASSDPDGEIVAWTWNFGDGNSASGSQVSHTFFEDGNYTVTVSVTDNDGSISSKNRSVSVTATPENEDPNANFSFNCGELQCSFDAGSSSDSDGEISAWAWNFGDGGNANGRQVSYGFKNEGIYSVTLTVTDDAGATDTRVRNVSVSDSSEPQNQAPDADFSFSCDFTECSFNGSTSSDSDGSPVNWSWTLGDGFNANGVTVVHDFGSAGNFNVTLSVTDDQGATDSRTRTVSIDAPDTNKSPEPRFSYECHELTCRFDASQSQDPDGNVVSYRWLMGDGSDAAGMSLEYRFHSSGSFRVALTVEDNEGGLKTITSLVQVQSSLPEIILSGDGSRHNGRSMATLRWTGAESENVELYRDGQLVAITPNDGKQIDTDIEEQRKLASYQLCQPSSQVCSPTLVLSFASGPGL